MNNKTLSVRIILIEHKGTLGNKNLHFPLYKRFKRSIILF